MLSRKLIVGTGLLAVVAFSVPAIAQQAAASSPPYPAACAATSVTPAKSDEAHSFYSAGRALYDEGNYDGAIAQFREAYRRDCSKHDLLVIISRSYELKGDRAEAVKALEVFLERQKDSPDAATHRTKIDNLKKQIAAQPPPPPAATVAPPVEVREHTVPPWILVGIGGAGVVTGIILIAAAPRRPGNCNADTEKCDMVPGESADQYAKEQSDGAASKNLPRAGAIFLASGGAVLLGGLLWHFLEPTGPVATTTGGATKPTLLPALSPGYAGLSLGGSF